MSDAADAKSTSNILGAPRKALMAMVIPILIGMLVQSLNNFIDAIWVSGIGTGALAATGVVFPFFFILIGIGNGLGVGASQAIARRIALGDREGANKAASHVLVIGVIVGFVITAIFALFAEPIFMAAGAGDYIAETMAYGLPVMLCSPIYMLSFIFSAIMRSEGAAKMSMNIQIVGVVVHMVLDPILIYGLGIGIEGAALASAISMVAAVIVAVYVYKRTNRMYIELSFRGFRFDAALDRDILRVGIPASMEMIFVSISSLIMNIIIVSVDPVNGVAIYTTGWRILDLLMLPATSFGSALVPISAAGFGCGLYEKVRDVYRYAIVYGEAIMIALMAVTLVCAPYIVTLFTYTGTSASLAEPMTEFVRIGCVFLPFTVLGVVTSSLFQSVGQGLKSMVATAFRNLLRVPICFMLAPMMSLTLLWWGLTAAEFIGGTLIAIWGIFLLRSLKRSLVPQCHTPAE